MILPKFVKKWCQKLLRPDCLPTYYLPWLTGKSAACKILLNNIESRFIKDSEGKFEIEVTQRDSNGVPRKTFKQSIANALEFRELSIQPVDGHSHGLLTLRGTSNWLSGVYVTLTDGQTNSITHGRYENLDYFSSLPKLILHLILLIGGLFRISFVTFEKNQFVYFRPDACSHLLFINLSNIENFLTIRVRQNERPIGVNRIKISPLGTYLLNTEELISNFLETGFQGVFHLQIQGSTRFNFYIVGTGAEKLNGPISIQHVK